MSFLKQHGGKLAVLALILLLLGGWMLLWHRIGSAVDSAAEESYYAGFVCNGAYYARCDAAALKCYTDESAPDASARGASVGNVQFETPAGTVSCEAFVCTLAAGTDHPPLLMLARAGDPVYELDGFAALDDSPSISAVCDAYGIASAADIASVQIAEGDGTPIDEITAPDDLAAFYEKLAALGDDLGEAGMAQAYYDVYIEKYGESAGISLENGEIQFADEETHDKAIALWSEGVCLVSVRLKNGLQLRDMVYAPVPQVFAVYGAYRLTVPFFG